ncbi:MAG: hypothetical protein JNG86_19865, partial [Verrucomicrobiaceae bacterium]|nr:hypothetical protein [Verrucomicrobiaceae bacterium]
MRACSPHQTAIVPLLMLISPLWLSAEEEPHVIPFAEIGARATAQDKGRSLGITLVKEGALLRCGLQKLAGRVTPEGLWLVSTENAGGEDFCITANAYGREGRDVVLTPEGRVTASDKLVQLIRPGLIEEYSVSADGVRQDFVIPKRPQGGGPLRVSLEVRGACAEAAVTGARLILNGSGRQITYGKLRVTDAEGRECAARIEVPAETKLRIVVEDAEAVYPLRIDPTFSDADWVSMNPDMLGKNALQMVIDEMMSDSQGNLYVAGSFTHIGSVQAASIARWDGTRWWPLGSGVDPNAIYSMVMMGTDLIVSGSFSTIGGVEASGLARWNGSIWQPVGGLSGLMGTLAVSGSKLYVGGSGLTIAGDPSVHSLVSWNGSVWTPVGNGLTGAVYCLATHGGHLQVGGLFQIHGAGGGLLTENVAGWNGTNWTFYSSGIGTDPVVDLEWHQGELWAVANQQPSTSMIYKWSGTEWSNMHTYDRGSSSGVLLSNGADLFLPVKGPTSSSDSTVSVLRYDAGAQGWATLGSLLLHTPGAGAKSLVMYG